MEQESSPEEVETPRRHRHGRGHRNRHPHGRAWVVATWIVLRLADLPLFWLAFRPQDSVPGLRVPAIVAILWTTVLFIGLWAKQIWARAITSIFLGICVCYWGYNATTQALFLIHKGDPVRTDSLPTLIATLLIVATLLYTAVMAVVLLSKNIKYLTDPAAGWKPRAF